LHDLAFVQWWEKDSRLLVCFCRAYRYTFPQAKRSCHLPITIKRAVATLVEPSSDAAARFDQAFIDRYNGHKKDVVEKIIDNLLTNPDYISISGKN